MSASSNDKITQSINGGSPVVTTVASPRSIGGTNLSGVALTYWPTATRVFFTTYKKTTSGAKDFATVTSWWAIVSGTTLGTLTRVGGAADAGNAVGDFIEMGPTAGWAEGIYEFGTKEHATDGTHDATKVAMLAATQTFTGAKTFSSAITVPDASIPFAKLINAGYEIIGRNTLTVAGDVLTVSSLPARKYLKIIYVIKSVNATNVTITFNGDTSSSYAYQYLLANNTTVTGGSGTNLAGIASILPVTAGNNDSIFGTFEIVNFSTMQKLISGNTQIVGNVATTYDPVLQVWGHWVNNAQISSITVTNPTTGDYGIGSELVVMGMD